MPPKNLALTRIARDIKELSEDKSGTFTFKQDASNIYELLINFVGPEGTPYGGFRFDMKITYPPRFPSSPPKCIMLTPIFHPNISADKGEICLNILKDEEWAPITTTISIINHMCLLETSR
eukprot:gnl/Chilomastix_caulleri/2788.p1 GENE.gnl/Chilomastix_caulleri/2788~~gnl/Chilomastix_caulleri/2788.p1  ORF type:complete len:121 (+),score=30.27 gnl/Chilomastix_caulleri/2788:77-439(+)